jgi:REP element-mobilizing transposase RayT
MPNHVHLLVKPSLEDSLSRILHSWKSYTAKQINLISGGAGQFWMDESFDHLVRDRADLESFRAYIRDNPGRARLTVGEYEVSRGSGLLV